MKALVIGVIFTLAIVSATSAFVSPTIQEEDVIRHGGGCRKSSPVGMCCHMDNKIGEVHCH